MKKVVFLTIMLLVACGNQETDTTESSPAPMISNSGYQAHIDPATGEFLQKPAVDPNKLKLSPATTFSVPATKPPPLKTIPSEVPGGGVMIEVKDRFMTDQVTSSGANKSK